MKQRTDKLLAAMPGGFEAALVSTDVNRFYFLGFDSGDAGTVLILPDKTYFIIDSRYIEIAEATVKEAEVILEGKALEQVRDILARTQAGKVDLLIGTHKLLQKDLQFHDLGLLVIDEEQRFGVTHKEKLRERAKQVDTLTLSAGP